MITHDSEYGKQYKDYLSHAISNDEKKHVQILGGEIWYT